MATKKEIKNYKKHLIKTFKHMSKNDLISESCPHIIDNTESILAKLSRSKSEIKWSYKIDPPWFIPISKDRQYRKENSAILLSGNMNSNESQLLYSFATSIIRINTGETIDLENPLYAATYNCCERSNSNEDIILRRYHMDVTNGSPDILETKSHLHYGGYLYEEEITALNTHYCIGDKIKVPRFPNPPVDFIILLDLLLKQFSTVIDKRFVNEPFWKSLVKKSEIFRLKKYYTSIMKYFTDTTDNTLFEVMCKKEFIL